MTEQDIKTVRVEIPGRDRIEFIQKDQESGEFSFVGCDQLSALIFKLKKEQGLDPRKWNIPTGTSHSDLLLKEFLLKLRGEYQVVYPHEEICHCRKVNTHEVEQAILCGAHSTEKVSRWTGASTACGTCRADVEKIIQERLKIIV